MKKIQELILSDEKRMAALQAVSSLNLPDCFIAAGFVRNMVWDYLHGYISTPLNDVDLIYFEKAQSMDPDRILEKLQQLLPEFNWEVKNQVVMHLRNGDSPYSSSTDAMTFWPEKETAVGVRLVSGSVIEVVALFGLDSLFSGYITHNPKRSQAVFAERVQSKGWLQKWPQLKIRAC
jgi:hypothetical protein